MKKNLNKLSLFLLIALTVFSCTPTGENDDLQPSISIAESAKQAALMTLSDVYLSLRVSRNVTGYLTINVRNTTLSTTLYSMMIPASNFAGNGIDYVTHQISFSGTAAYLSPEYTYELSVSRSVDSTPLDFIHWESSAGNHDPLVGYDTDHGSNDYVFGLYNLYNLESEQPHGGEGHEINTNERWQEFPGEFTADSGSDRIDIYVQNYNGNASGSLFIEIWDVAGNVLASESILADDLPIFSNGNPTTIYFNSSLGLELGEKYRIALKRTDMPSSNNRISWMSNHPLTNPDSYPHGNSFGTPDPTAIDLSFETYHNGLIDQTNIFYDYGTGINNTNWVTQEFVVGML